MIVFARPSYSKCCTNSNDCIYSNICVSSGTSPYDVDGDGDFDYCLNSEWWDCNTDSQCPSNQWCNTGTKDCVADYTQLCASCSRSAQCASGTTCISGKCRIEDSESGLCYNGIDDDCDGDIDFEDSDCCGGLGASCSNNDAQCCGNIPCDYPNEAGSTTCGCPTGYDWVPALNDCIPQGTSCGVPPSNCNTNPLQSACLYTITPWNPTQACCEYGTYEGVKDYTWRTDNIQTY